MRFDICKLAPDIASNTELNMYFEEYKLIQNKQDQLGDFKFRVKGWSSTVISSGIAFALSIDKASPFIFLLLCIPVIFIVIEERPRLQQKKLSDRALLIEELFQVIFDERNKNNHRRAKSQLRTKLQKMKGPMVIGHILRKNAKQKYKFRDIVSKSFYINHRFHFGVALIQALLLITIFCSKLDDNKVYKVSIISQGDPALSVDAKYSRESFCIPCLFEKMDDELGFFFCDNECWKVKNER